MKKVVELTDLEKQFVASWDGDPESTATKCGITAVEARHFLKQVPIRDAIRDRELLDNPARQRLNIATRAERQEFWSELMRGQIVNPTDGTKTPVNLDTRVKASELLGKSECDFSERRIHTGENGGPILGAVIHVEEKDLAERHRFLLAKKIGSELKFLE